MLKVIQQVHGRTEIKIEVCVIPASKLWTIVSFFSGLKSRSVHIYVSHQENPVIKVSVSASTAASPDRHLSVVWRGMTPSYVGLPLSWLRMNPMGLKDHNCFQPRMPWDYIRMWIHTISVRGMLLPKWPMSYFTPILIVLGTTILSINALSFHTFPSPPISDWSLYFIFWKKLFTTLSIHIYLSTISSQVGLIWVLRKFLLILSIRIQPLSAVPVLPKPFSPHLPRPCHGHVRWETRDRIRNAEILSWSRPLLGLGSLERLEVEKKD